MLCVCLSHCTDWCTVAAFPRPAYSRFSFIFCKYFFGCNPKRGGKLMSPVQLSFNSCSCIRYFSDCPNSEWNYLMPLSWIVNNGVMNHFLKCLIPFFHNSG